LRENAGQILLAVIDCTGHGVPGAFMTMTVNSVLNQIVDTIGVDDPARILNEMNRILQKTLRLRQGEGRTVDAGLDIALCFIDQAQGTLIFAGAGISLYVVSHGTLHEVKGDRQRVGYRTSDINYTYTSHPLSIEPGVNYFAASDGYFDEGGGAEGYSFGNDRFENMLKQHADLSLKEQGRLLEQALNEWRGSRKQRDDITMVGFNF
jgi:serine phosphatase RsbU (regulator of sigma subunit)